MGQGNKKIIREEDFREWLASTGNLFPGNDAELNRFEKLYADYEYTLEEVVVDPFAIINGNFKPRRTLLNPDTINNVEEYQLAARNLQNIPEHILKKIKKNQNGLNPEETGDSIQKD